MVPMEYTVYGEWLKWICIATVPIAEPTQCNTEFNLFAGIAQEKILTSFNGSLVLKLHKSVRLNDTYRTKRMEFYRTRTLNDAYFSHVVVCFIFICFALPVSTAISLVKHDLPLVNPCCLFSVNFIFQTPSFTKSICQSAPSYAKNYSHKDFLSDSLRDSSESFKTAVFWKILVKMATTLVFLQLLGSFLSLHNT